MIFNTHDCSSKGSLEHGDHVHWCRRSSILDYVPCIFGSAMQGRFLCWRHISPFLPYINLFFVCVCVARARVCVCVCVCVCEREREREREREYCIKVDRHETYTRQALALKLDVFALQVLYIVHLTVDLSIEHLTGTPLLHTTNCPDSMRSAMRIIISKITSWENGLCSPNYLINFLIETLVLTQSCQHFFASDGISIYRLPYSGWKEMQYLVSTWPPNLPTRHIAARADILVLGSWRNQSWPEALLLLLAVKYKLRSSNDSLTLILL